MFLCLPNVNIHDCCDRDKRKNWIPSKCDYSNTLFAFATTFMTLKAVWAVGSLLFIMFNFSWFICSGKWLRLTPVTRDIKAKLTRENVEAHWNCQNTNTCTIIQDINCTYSTYCLISAFVLKPCISRRFEVLEKAALFYDCSNFEIIQQLCEWMGNVLL